MADIRLVKPQANAVHNVPCATGNRFVLDFPSDAALFAKDGDDLVLSFEDGSSIRLQDFYTTYSKEEMPSFEMEGAEISGEDFFAALGNPDLMPAAGPSAAAATRGGGFNQYGNVELLQGIDRLGGLDISFNWGQEHEDDLYAYGHRDIDYGVSVVPVVPGILDPDIPVVDDPDNPNDGGVGPVVDRLEVWEAGLEEVGSKAGDESVPTVAHGGMNISAPDGVATIVIGTVTVFANGHLVLGSNGEPVRVETGEGYLQVTGFNPATGRLEYTYTLTDSTQEHDQGEANEHFTHLLPVTVTDSDGDRGSSTISVVIRDDEPTAHNDANSITEGDSEDVVCSGNVLTGAVTKGEGTPTDHDVIGADGHMNDESKVSWKTTDLESLGENTYKTEYGTIKLNADGTYEYTLDGENDAVRVLENEHTTLTETFTYTITDADGDTKPATLTITIKGKNHDVEVTNGDTLIVDEADLEDGSKVDDNNFTATAQGFMKITAHDGLETVTIGGVKVVENGQLVENPVVPDGSVGKITVTDLIDHEKGTWTLKYTYTLNKATQEHTSPAQGADRNELPSEHVFEVHVWDQDGSDLTGSIKVDIVDDVPTAKNDWDSVQEDVRVTTSGNVIEGVRGDGEESQESGTDIQGADGADGITKDGINTGVTSIAFGNVTVTTLDEDGSFTINGAYGELTISPDGSYTYTLDKTNSVVMGLENGETRKDFFTYTLTDADGDSHTANLTITVKGTSNSIPKFEVEPLAVDEANLTVTDENKHAGNAPGTENVVAEKTGTCTVIVKDGLASLSLKIGESENAIEVPLTLNADGTVTLAESPQHFKDANGYLTIDSISGSGEYTIKYTYHLTTATRHECPAGVEADRNDLANDQLHSFTLTVKDQDGSTQSGDIKVNIYDDIPVLEGEPSWTSSPATVTEDNMNQEVPVNLGEAFAKVVENQSYGADGPNSTGAAVYTLELSDNKVETTLMGLDDGKYETIYLVKNGDGSVSGFAGDTKCFTITINPQDGKATFTLLKPVKHAEQGEEDTTLTLETVGGSFKVKYTITDADGDEASRSLDLGEEGVFQIKDSETRVALIKRDPSVDAALTVDESFAEREKGPDRFVDDITGSDGNAGKTAELDAKDFFDITSGADDQGLEGLEVEHKFELKIGNNGEDSGLQGLYVNGTETIQDDILLFNENGVIVGRVGSAEGPTVFTLEIDQDSGHMTLTMYDDASIVHDNKTRFDEVEELAGKISVVLSVTDRDGDTNFATADITLKFEDDGPALDMPEASDMQTATVNGMGTISGHMDVFDFGADGPAAESAVVVTVKDGETTYTFYCKQDADGAWSAKAGENETHSFIVDEQGNFTYSRPVSEDGISDGNVTIEVTLKDGDGDIIRLPTTKFAPESIGENVGTVQEAGVAGHNPYNAPQIRDANDSINGVASVSKTITLQQEGQNKDTTLTLNLWDGTIAHTTFTKVDNGEDVTPPGEPYPINTSLLTDITNGLTLYLVQENGKPALSGVRPQDSNYYGTLVFTMESEGTWTWKFVLNENGTLTNSMTEGEKIDLVLNLGVSDGMLQNDSGTIHITILGTNDKPVFITGDKDSNVVGAVEVSDATNTPEGLSSCITGKLKATDSDTDNSGVNNGLIFSLVGFKESKVGTVDGEDYNPYDSENEQDKIEHLISSAPGKVTPHENSSTSIETRYGTLTVYENGSYTYEVKDTSAIAGNEYVTETFTVLVKDNHGSWDKKDITITLRDENKNTEGREVSLTAKEEGVAGNSGKPTTAADYNTPIPTQDGKPVAGQGMVLFKDEDVNDILTLKVNNSKLVWEGHNDQQPVDIEFSQESLTVSIAGTKTSLYLVASKNGEDWTFEWVTDAPEKGSDVVGKLVLTREENGDVTSSFKLDPKNKKPLDNQDNHDFDNSGFLDQLSQGETVKVELPLTATSSGGDEAALTITIEGTNDRPVIDSIKVKVEDKDEEISDGNSSLGVEPADIDSDTGTEAKPDLSGTILASDVDNDDGSGSNNIEDHGLIFTLSDMHSEEGSTISQEESVSFLPNGQESNPPVGNFDGQYSTIKTTYGELELDPDTGNFTYTMDEPKLVEGEPNAIMALGAGQSVTETYTVRVTDSHGSWTEKTFEITITGTNDRPKITSTKKLEVHGTEDKAVDKNYHPEQGDLSIAWVEADEYDIGDKIAGYYLVDYEDGELVSEVKESVAITVKQLRAYLENYSHGLSASDSSKAELRARLNALDADDVIATLKVETVDGKGKLTLEPNQGSSFIQALNQDDKLTLDLSKLCGMYVSAKDTHNAYADGVNVTLVLHGKNDAETAISAYAPTVKEEGVYYDSETDNGNLPTVGVDGTDSEIGYTQHRTSSKGEFTISDRDAGQITFTYKNDFTDNHEKEFKEAGTTIGENAVSYEQESEGAETYYVFGTYGYYEISLTSSLDVDQGEKTFDYTYYLYSEETPKTIQDQFGDDFDDRLTAVNSIPQSERVVDTVELTVKTEGGNSTSLTLNATVVGSNDVPVIESVAEVKKEGAITLDDLEDGATGPNTMELVEEEDGEKTLQITLQSSKTGAEQQFVGKIIGVDPDRKGDDTAADGTEIRNYSFVLNDKASNVWTISTNEDGEQQATSDFGYITIDAEGVFHIHLYKDAGKTLAAGAESSDIFAGLGVRCTDTLGATSEIVNLSGKLVGVDDIATVTPSNETIWEGVHAYDGEPKGEIPETSESNWAEHGGTVTGLISVNDPDEGDTISRDKITVSINDELKYVIFENGDSITYLQTDYGEINFKWTENGDLQYTYKILDNKVKNEIQELNLGETIKDEFSVQFHSHHTNGSDTTLSNPATISITIKGTNDAPVIDSVIIGDTKYNPDTTEEPIAGGTVHYRESIQGTIVSLDVDNADGSDNTVSTLVYGILIYTDEEGEKHLVHAHTGEDGRTVYTAADNNYKLPDDMGERLTFLPQATLEHGSIVVNENGQYTYYHESDSITGNTTESVWITVRDPHGAMDSVEISFTLTPGEPGDLPEVTMEDNVDLSVIEPNPNDSEGDHLVHVGSNGTASSLDPENLGLSLSVRYYEDGDGKFILVAERNEEGKFVDTSGDVIKGQDGNPVSEDALLTATGKLVEQGDGSYKWEYRDANDRVIEGFPPVELDIRLSDSGNSNSSWDDASYSLSTDYGTVYVTDSGELRFELDNRADALNAGEVINETVTIWINGKPQEQTLNLKVTGTADASEVEAPALTVDMDLNGGQDSANLEIDDIDNSDANGKQDEHQLFIGNIDDEKPIEITFGKPIYVIANDDKLVYSYTKPTGEDADLWYGTLTFSQDSEGGYTYTFEAADSDINKKLADDHTTKFSIPIYVKDIAPEGSDEEDFDEVHYSTTKTQTTIDITIIGKADTPDARDDTVTITEDGTIPDDVSDEEKGDSAGPGTHAVKGNLQVVDYDGLGVQISGMHVQTSEGEPFEGEGRVVPGDFGTLVLNSDGTYTYTVNYDSLQHLSQGENKKDTFTVEVKTPNSDPKYVTITVNVQGVNDLPTVSVTPVRSVLEQHGTTVTATGKVEAQDIDEDSLTYGIKTGEESFSDQAYVVGTWEKNAEGEEELKLSLTTEKPQDESLVGTITIDTNGEYTFTLESNSEVVRQLEAGESASIVVDMGAKDIGDPVTKPVTITIHGSNENPTVSTTLQVNEDIMVVEDNTLTVHVGQYDYTATDAEKGDMTFTFERGGEYMKEVTTNISVDGREYEISLTMGDDGTITIQYPDTLKEYINGLGANDTLLIIDPDQMEPKLNVVVEDNAGGKTSSTLALTIKGKNDAIEDLVADDVKDTSGTLSFTDVDRSDEHTITFNDLYANGGALLSVSTNELPEKPLDVFDVHGTKLGTLTFTWKEDGASKELSYTFEPDDAYLNTLPVGESKDISFSVTVNDGNGSSSTTESLSFKVTNKNDAPEISQSDVNIGTVIFSDDDLQDTKHTVLFSNLKKNQEGEDISFTLDSTTTGQQSQSSTVYLGDVQVGTLTITYTPGENNQDNKITYSFTAEEDLNDLDVGEHELEFSVSIKDAHGGESSKILDSFTVTNGNDVPVIAITKTGNTGTFTITDEDTRDTPAISISYDEKEYPVSQNDSIEVPDLGSFFFTKDSSGTWRYTFTADPELQASMTAGDNEEFSIDLNVSDGHTGGQVSKAFSVTVEGTNSQPEKLESVDLVISSLDDSYDLDLPLIDADGDSLTYTFKEGNYGSVVLDNGQYIYQVNEDALTEVQENKVQDELHYTIFDGVNTVEGTLSVNLDVSALNLPEEPEIPTEGGETLIPDGDTDDTQPEIPGQPEEPEETSDADEDFEAIVYALENGEDDTPLFARNTYSLADGEEMYSLSPDDPEENTVDIVAYDSTDYMVDGGEGVSFMVSENEDLTMDDILQGDGQHGPIVSNIDVLITGHGAESLTNMDQLARDYGISVDRDANALTLDESWQKVDSGHTDTQVFSNGSLTLETSLDVSCPSDDLNVQAAMHQVTNN